MRSTNGKGHMRSDGKREGQFCRVHSYYSILRGGWYPYRRTSLSGSTTRPVRPLHAASDSSRRSAELRASSLNAVTYRRRAEVIIVETVKTRGKRHTVYTLQRPLSTNANIREHGGKRQKRRERGRHCRSSIPNIVHDAQYTPHFTSFHLFRRFFQRSVNVRRSLLGIISEPLRF